MLENMYAKYEISTDSIRKIPENTCLISFDGFKPEEVIEGDVKKPNFESDNTTAFYRGICLRSYKKFRESGSNDKEKLAEFVNSELKDYYDSISSVKTHSKFDFLLKMAVGKNYTIFYRCSYTNVPTVLQFTLNEVRFGKFAQNENALYFNVKLKGNRVNTLLTLTNDFVVLEGWVEVAGKTDTKINDMVSKMNFHSVSDYAAHKDLVFIKHYFDKWNSDDIDAKYIFNFSIMEYLRRFNIKKVAGAIL